MSADPLIDCGERLRRMRANHKAWQKASDAENAALRARVAELEEATAQWQHQADRSDARFREFSADMAHVLWAGRMWRLGRSAGEHAPGRNDDERLLLAALDAAQHVPDGTTADVGRTRLDDELAALRARVERLTEALELLASLQTDTGLVECAAVRHIARAVLAEEGNEA